MSDPIECENCGAPVKHDTQPGEYYPRFEDCPFCRQEQDCAGHFKWLDGQLDQYGRTKHEMIPCKEVATVYDTEGQAFYCEEGWKAVDGQDVEEFALRVPDE